MKISWPHILIPILILFGSISCTNSSSGVQSETETLENVAPLEETEGNEAVDLAPVEGYAFNDIAKCKQVFSAFPEENFQFPVPFGKDACSKVLKGNQLIWELESPGDGLIFETVDLEKCHFMGNHQKGDQMETFYFQAWKAPENSTLVGFLRLAGCPMEVCPSNIDFWTFTDNKWEKLANSPLPKFSPLDFWPDMSTELAAEFPSELPLQYSFSIDTQEFRVSVNDLSLSEEIQVKIESMEYGRDLSLEWNKDHFEIGS